MLTPALAITTPGASREERFDDFRRNDMFQQELGSFFNAVAGEAPPAVSLGEGISSLRVALAMRESLSRVAARLRLAPARAGTLAAEEPLEQVLVPAEELRQFPAANSRRRLDVDDRRALRLGNVPERLGVDRPVDVVERRGRAFRNGLVTSLANPKLAVFFVALFPQFIGERGDVLPAALADFYARIPVGQHGEPGEGTHRLAGGEEPDERRAPAGRAQEAAAREPVARRARRGGGGPRPGLVMLR